jgi:hypothetical protein
LIVFDEDLILRTAVLNSIAAARRGTRPQIALTFTASVRVIPHGNDHHLLE